MDSADKCEEQKFFVLLYIYHYRILEGMEVDRQVLREKIPDLSSKNPRIISESCLDNILNELLENRYIKLKESDSKVNYFLSDSGRKYLEENELLFPHPKDSILERYLPKDPLIKLLSALADDLNAQISIMDESGQFRVANYPPKGLCESCIRQESKPNVSCVCCDILAARRAEKNGAYSYRCHGGLIEFIAPIKSNGDICGFVLLGRIVPNDLDADSFVQYCKAIRGISLNPENISKQIEKGATEDQINVMEKITNGIALLLSAMVRDLNDYATKLDTLHDVIESGVAVLSLKEILDRILESTKKVLDYDGAVIWKFDPDQKKLFPMAWDGGLPEFTDKPDFDLAGDGFVSWIARGKEPLLISNVSDHIRKGNSPVAKYLEYIDEKELGSFLGVPIFVENATFGVLAVEKHGTGRFTELHQKLLSAIAQITGIVIKNFMLLDVLTDISKIDSLDELLDAASRKLPLLVGAEYCSIFLFDSERERIILKATNSSFLSNEVNRAYYSKDRPGLTWRLAQEGETIMSHNDHKETRWVGRYLEAGVPGYHGFLGCTFKDKSGVVSGVIRFIGKQVLSFSEFDKRLAEILSTWLSLAIDRMRLATIVGGHTELLMRIANIQKSSTDIDNFLDDVSREVALTLKCNECVIAIGNKKGEYVIKGVYGSHRKGEIRSAEDGSLIDKVIQEKNMIHDTKQEIPPALEIVARLCIPLMYGRELTGVLLLKKVISDPTTGFKSDDERTGNIIAAEVARTIHEVQQRDNVSELLRKVDEQYMGTRDAQTALEYMVGNLGTVIDDAFGTLYRYDTRDDIFVRMVYSTTGGEPPEKTKAGHTVNAFINKNIQDIPEALKSPEHKAILESDKFDDTVKEHIRNIGSEYGIPLIVAGRVYGILFFYKNQVYGFSISDKRAARDLAAKASLLLEINELFDGMSRLYKTSLALQSKLQLKDLLNSVVKGITTSIGVDRARLYVISDDGQRIESIAQVGLIEEENSLKFENREIFGSLHTNAEDRIRDRVGISCLEVKRPVLQGY